MTVDLSVSHKVEVAIGFGVPLVDRKLDADYILDNVDDSNKGFKWQFCIVKGNEVDEVDHILVQADRIRTTEKAIDLEKNITASAFGTSFHVALSIDESRLATLTLTNLDGTPAFSTLFSKQVPFDLSYEGTAAYVLLRADDLPENNNAVAISIDNLCLRGKYKSLRNDTLLILCRTSPEYSLGSSSQWLSSSSSHESPGTLWCRRQRWW